MTLPADATVGADDDGDVFVVTPRVRLDADYACFRRLGWQCVLLDEESDPARAPARLVAAGYTDVTRMPRLVELAHPRGHRVVIVLHTRRVQIRIDVDTPLDDRVAAAVHVAEEVAAASTREGDCVRQSRIQGESNAGLEPSANGFEVVGNLWACS